MLLLVIVALIVLALFGIGFTVHLLWWIAIIAAVVWLLGFVFNGRGRGGPYGGRRRRWYYW